MGEINWTQLMAIILGGNAALVAGLVYLVKSLAPALLEWMRRKIDEKNGHIGELVDETKALANDISRLTKALLQQIEQGNCTQAQTLCAMQDTCAQHSQQIGKLIDKVEQLLEGRAA